MKEIGEKLKETRETMEISIEEASSDMKLDSNQIEELENGNIEAFPDIFYLKYFIRDYAKYLGLDYEDLVDEFNEYLFDYTSKISIDDIKKAKEQIKEDKEKVRSPYTITKKHNVFTKVLMYLLVSIIIIAIIYMVISNFI